MNGRLVSSNGDKAYVGLLGGERSVRGDVKAAPHAPVAGIHRGGVPVVAGLVGAVVVAHDASAVGIVVVGASVTVVVVPVHTDVRILLLARRRLLLLRREADHLTRRQLGALAGDETETESQGHENKTNQSKHLAPLSLG
jgi:hypothetical protein